MEKGRIEVLETFSGTGGNAVLNGICIFSKTIE